MELPVVFGEPPDDITLQSAALVASHFGVLSDVRGVHFPVSVGEFPNGNAACTGAASARSFFPDLSLPAGGPASCDARQSSRSIRKVADRHRRYSRRFARSGAHVGHAQHGCPHVDSLHASSTQMPSSQAYGAPRWLQADRPSAIGTYTTDERLKLHGTGSIDLYFRLPPDLFLRARQSVPCF